MKAAVAILLTLLVSNLSADEPLFDGYIDIDIDKYSVRLFYLGNDSNKYSENVNFCESNPDRYIRWLKLSKSEQTAIEKLLLKYDQVSNDVYVLYMSPNGHRGKYYKYRIVIIIASATKPLSYGWTAYLINQEWEQKAEKDED